MQAEEFLKISEEKTLPPLEQETKKQTKKIRRCGICKKVGHSRNVCPNNKDLNIPFEWNRSTETFCGMITPTHGKASNIPLTKNNKKRKSESNPSNGAKTPTNCELGYTNITQKTPCSMGKNRLFINSYYQDNKENGLFSHVHPFKVYNNLEEIIPSMDFLFPYENMKWYESMEYSVDFENIQPGSRKDMLAFCKFNSYKKINYEDILDDSPLFKPLSNSIFDFIEDEMGSKSPILNF
ncbi:hypothetical protein PNEG_00354 [Pneumocystis murina B123]|uniref:Uncharacterized protein n=1 Tax=Pneumocystis murina (strain B123) TaxID=1069680 RepID=M7PBT1_PNEMU|nr:hypothetical protein PNEG_00354 [Pneumocystis murina B123]EMR11325.1 hypothetical protein PNEG_00354 [Pneumocystis murina B123]